VRLEFAGVLDVAAGQDQVWERLLDHEFVASCASAVESVTPLDDRHFTVVTGLGVGSVKLRFELQVELADLHPPRSARMVVQGKAPGSALHAQTSVTLESVEAARTRLTWAASSDVHGTVASVGARLLKGTAKRLTDGFWKTFARRVSRAA
jgi:carbon monoxide dehydrogenase subunit G